MQRSAPPPSLNPWDTWSLTEEGLACPATVQPALRGLLTEYLLHRYRALQTQGDRFLLPMDLVLTDDQIRLRYRDPALLAQAVSGGSKKSESWQDFKLHELLPVLSTLCECQEEGIGGFSPSYLSLDASCPRCPSSCRALLPPRRAAGSAPRVAQRSSSGRGRQGPLPRGPARRTRRSRALQRRGDT